VQKGIEGYVICNSKGQVLRRLPSLTSEKAEMYAQKLLQLTDQANSACRDLDPKVVLLISSII
jgi:hypothetical protein